MLKRLVGALILAVVSLAAWGAQAPGGGGPTPLDSYLDNLKTLRATFLQVLVDAHGKEIDRSTGTIVVVRPGKLRWDIHAAKAGGDAGAGGAKAGGAGDATAKAGGSAKPDGNTVAGDADSGGQLLVADGRNLWFL